uniref:Ig-like domain-containing protein n=1 Tax=Periophthalmus magnuspinnatus TaxID=409849 RepID=A0A3B4B8F3_9GOBI
MVTYTPQSCVHVTQSPSSASVVPGGSVSLQCSLQPKNNKNQIQCPQQQQVHWFRAGSVEPHTGLMSHFTNYSCVYSLSKTIGHSSEAGTYYCAVHTCGHILFGTGTTLDIGTSYLSNQLSASLTELSRTWYRDWSCVLMKYSLEYSLSQSMSEHSILAGHLNNVTCMYIYKTHLTQH